MPVFGAVVLPVIERLRPDRAAGLRVGWRALEDWAVKLDRPKPFGDAWRIAWASPRVMRGELAPAGLPASNDTTTRTTNASTVHLRVACMGVLLVAWRHFGPVLAGSS